MKAKMRFIFLWIIFLTLSAHGAAPPADISFMVMDLKYSREHGVKVCEIQNGICSTFLSDSYIYGEYGTICPRFLSIMSQYSPKKWNVPHLFSSWQFAAMIPTARGWKAKKRISEIFNDPAFVRKGSKVPYDPSEIESYSAMVFLKKSHIGDIQMFHLKYPGVLVIDGATYPFWNDKSKISNLFTKKRFLSQFKPHFKEYKKIYREDLADQIGRELPADRYVIKPLSAFLGNGVIIVDRIDLDETLNYILKGSNQLRGDPDPAYSYWTIDRNDTFLIEEFYASDPIVVPDMGDKIYQPTMRVAFLMICDRGDVAIHLLGNHWQLPLKSLDDRGSLNEKHKTSVKSVLYSEVEPDIEEEVYWQLNQFLPIFYKEMLKQHRY